MGEVSKRELNQSTASVLKRVTDTEDIVVTEHGKPRWRIIAFHDQTPPTESLQHEGRYAPPSTQPTSWPRHPGGQKYSVDEVVGLLDDMRGGH